jgi:hypothetical protein
MIYNNQDNFKEATKLSLFSKDRETIGNLGAKRL